MLPVTNALARLIAESRWEDVPVAVRHETKRALLNIAGCMLAGRREAPIGLLRAAFPGSDAMTVALIDGAAANVLDFDDTHLPTVIHPGPPVGPAVFALARERQVSGPELLHAFLLGVEVACRMGNAVTPGHYERGWHITGTCGVFGAAVAASRLLGLSLKQVQTALGIAATQAAGLVETLGGMAKILNSGFAARNGIAAALLAAQGFEGPERPIEGARGFVNVLGGSQDYARLTEGFGTQWELGNVAYKPYPCGVVLHALIDACLALRGQAFDRVTIALHPLAIERADRPAPRDGLEAKLSAQHCAAVALLYGAVGVDQFSDEVAANPEVARLRAKVELTVDERLDKAAATVNLHTRGGLSTAHKAPRIAMSDAELEAKFRALAGPRADEWMRFIRGLDSSERVVLPG